MTNSHSDRNYELVPATCASKAMAQEAGSEGAVYLYATNLPCRWKFCGIITHTFITIENRENQVLKYAAYGPSNNVPFFGVNWLAQKYFVQDENILLGRDKRNLKAKIEVPIPEGVTFEQFASNVAEAVDSYIGTDPLRYNFLPMCNAEGNCNTSTSTVLLKSGVSRECVRDIVRQIPGLAGISALPKPWTLEERRKALEQQSKKRIERFNEKFRKSIYACPPLMHLLHFVIPETPNRKFIANK